MIDDFTKNELIALLEKARKEKKLILHNYTGKLYTHEEFLEFIEKSVFVRGMDPTQFFLFSITKAINNEKSFITADRNSISERRRKIGTYQKLLSDLNNEYV